MALFGDLALMEILVIVALAVMVFGRDLPRVAAKAYSQVQKARRALTSVWRESGVGEEFRRLQRELDREAQEVRRHDPRELARDATRRVEEEVLSARRAAEQAVEGVAAEESGSQSSSQAGEEEASDSVEEPTEEARRRPPWYPETHPPPTPAAPAAPAEREDAGD